MIPKPSNNTLPITERKRGFKPCYLPAPPLAAATSFTPVNPKPSNNTLAITERRRGFKPCYLPAPPLTAAMPALDDQTAQVRRFLDACTPPMSHFLPKFIAFGCNNEDFLRAVHSWTDDVIDSFLKSVSSCGENEFTGMDIFVLGNHFRKYST